MGLRRLASGLVVAALVTLSGSGRAQDRQACIAQATAKMRACDARAQATETDKAPVLRGAACSATFDEEGTEESLRETAGASNRPPWQRGANL